MSKPGKRQSRRSGTLNPHAIEASKPESHKRKLIRRNQDGNVTIYTYRDLNEHISFFLKMLLVLAGAISGLLAGYWFASRQTEKIKENNDRTNL